MSIDAVLGNDMTLGDFVAELTVVWHYYVADNSYILCWWMMDKPFLPFLVVYSQYDSTGMIQLYRTSWVLGGEPGAHVCSLVMQMAARASPPPSTPPSE